MTYVGGGLLVVLGLLLVTGLWSEMTIELTSRWRYGTDSTVCSGVSSPPISPSSTSKSCGFTASTTTPAPRTASGFESVACTP